MELLGSKLKKADDLSNINRISGKTPQKKLADLLYIYDMKIEGYPDTDIVYAFDKYYKDKTTNISDNTIREYFSIAESYIDKEKYKELITGK